MTTTTSVPTYPPLRSFDRLFIGGAWVPPATTRVIGSIAAGTGLELARVPEATEADVDAAVSAAREAFDRGPWPRTTAAERISALRRVREAIAERLDDMCVAFSAEIGAPLGVSRAFHESALNLWDDNIRLLETFAFEEERLVGDATVRLVREPVGVVGIILPWNGPVTTASLKMAPALAAGCPVIVKPAPEGPVSMMLLAEALEAADLPPGVVSVLPAGREVGEHLVRHAGVDKISFTGSTAAGKRVMALCADRVARVTLELGGKSAGIVLDDLALDDFLSTLVQAGIGHTGQVCAALTRLVVPRRRQAEIADAVVGMLDGLTVGDPFAEGTDLGPLAAERQRDRVEGYVRIGQAEGARLACGGRRPAHLDRGWYYEPTLFTDVTGAMRIAREEVFGPVLCIQPFDTVEEAISIANDSDYGLSGAVFASDTVLAERVARSVRTGQITVNGWGLCLTQPAGGFKQSGLGREGGPEGIGEHLETKIISGL
ncbi:aldehyde dehydrogenase [Pseudonocardia ailaonensis]|uniref:Aldehyde dehydrogenase n=1 Tax=Pseudonocardia ailaonensis TaxID=367279 RepID=A0ABN2N4K6_9PSEU